VTPGLDRIEAEAMARIRSMRGRLVDREPETERKLKGFVEITIGLALMLGIRRAWTLTGERLPVPAGDFREWVRQTAASVPPIARPALAAADAAGPQAARVVDVGTRLVSEVIASVAPPARDAVRVAVASGVTDEPATESIAQIRSRFERAVSQAMLSAFHEGLAETASLPAVVSSAPLWRSVAIRDEVNRGNPNGRYPEPHRHFQFSGYTAPMREFRRRGLLPPYGMHCRCTLVPVTMEEAERDGLFRNGVPVPGALAALNGDRERLIDAGLIPDRGWRRS
jgi:hypothetical protein